MVADPNILRRQFAWRDYTQIAGNTPIPVASHEHRPFTRLSAIISSKLIYEEL